MIVEIANTYFGRWVFIHFGARQDKEGGLGHGIHYGEEDALLSTKQTARVDNKHLFVFDTYDYAE